VNENYSVRFALLEISRSHKETHIQAGGEKNDRERGKPRNDFARQWVEVRRGCVFVPVDSFAGHRYLSHRVTGGIENEKKKRNRISSYEKWFSQLFDLVTFIFLCASAPLWHFLFHRYL
jgi:hypothetical protein